MLEITFLARPVWPFPFRFSPFPWHSLNIYQILTDIVLIIVSSAPQPWELLYVELVGSALYLLSALYYTADDSLFVRRKSYNSIFS